MIGNRKFLAATIITVVALSNVCFGWSDEGFQYWPTIGISYQVTKDWQFYFEQEERLGDDGGNMYYEHSDISMVYSGMAEWIDLGFNYRLIYQKDGQDHYKYESRPHFNVTFKGKMCGFDVSDRSRLEYRDMENSKDTWRYRNKITVKFPIELTEYKLRPYVANDAFIDLDAEDFTKNRFYTGFTFPLTKNIKGDIYHMWQANKTSTEWTDQSILGTKITFIF